MLFFCFKKFILCAHVCGVHLWMWVPVHMHEGPRAMLSVFPSLFSSFSFWDWVFHWARSSSVQCGWLATGFQRSAWLHTLCEQCYAQLLTWALEIRTQVFMFVQGVLLTEPSPQLENCFLKTHTSGCKRGYNINYFCCSNSVMDFSVLVVFFYDNCVKIHLLVKVENLVWGSIASERVFWWNRLWVWLIVMCDVYL